MEAAERDASSASDSDATRLSGTHSDRDNESVDDALSDEPLSVVRDAVRARQTAVINLTGDHHDDSEAEFEIVPAAPPAREDVSDSGSDSTLPVGLGTEAEGSTVRKRKRLRRGDDKKHPEDVVKPAVPTKPTVVIKPQPTECTVCYDPCTISGRHRLVSLKCGHVFGKRCIDRWVLERKTCPNCSVAVRKVDIRPLFTDHVAVVDNSGVEDMTQKFEAEKSRRIHVETELSRAKLQLQLAKNEAKKFQDESERWRKQVAGFQCRTASARFTAAAASQPTTPVGVDRPNFSQVSTPVSLPPRTLFSASQLSQGGGGFLSQSSFASPPPRSSGTYASQYASQSSTPIRSEPGPTYREVFQLPLQSSRVCAFTSSCSIVCVGEAMTPTSFGIIKLSTADARHAVRIPAHSSAVRDVSISTQDDLVLSVAWDGKAVVSNLRSDSVVMQYMLPPNRRNAWSCTFSQVDPFVFFCGFQDGTIAQYDMRQQAVSGGSVVALYELPVRQPVHSIRACAMMGGGDEQLVAGTFAGFGIWGSDKLQHPSPGDGTTPVSSFHEFPSCSAVSSAQTKRSRLVVTTRSQPPTVSAKHTLFELSTLMGDSTDPLFRSSIEGFRTPQAMSRPAVWEARGGKTMVASWDDEQKCVNIWDESTKQVQARLASGQAVVDVQHSIADGEWRRSKALLGVLSPQRLVVYAGND